MTDISLTPENLIRAVLRQRCRYHENYAGAAHWWWRWWYTVKAAACIALGRSTDLYGDSDAVDSVAILNQRSVYSMDCWDAQEWDEVAVQHGVLRGWHYDVIQNGNC